MSSFLRSSGFPGATATAELGLLYQGPSLAEEGLGGRGVCWGEQQELRGWSARAVPIESGNPEGGRRPTAGDGPIVKPSECAGRDGRLAELNQGSWLLCRSHEAAQTPGKVEIRAAAPEPGLEGLGTGRAGLSLCRGKQQGSRRGGTRGLRSHS